MMISSGILCSKVFDQFHTSWLVKQFFVVKELMSGVPIYNYVVGSLVTGNN
jgi:hypothetical protein